MLKVYGCYAKIRQINKNDKIPQNFYAKCQFCLIIFLNRYSHRSAANKNEIY